MRERKKAGSRESASIRKRKFKEAITQNVRGKDFLRYMTHAKNRGFLAKFMNETRTNKTFFFISASMFPVLHQLRAKLDRIILRFCFFSIFSDSSRHRPHREVPHPGIRVPGEGPKAVHGRLRRNPSHEQCQSKAMSCFPVSN